MILPGIDIVEIDRLDNIKQSFINHVLSTKEIEIYKSYANQRQKEYLAGRFAAKEAIIKCLSAHEIPNMKDLEIMNDESGQPIVNYKDYKINISISHEKHYAIAIAILEE